MGEACLKRKKYTNFIYAFALKTYEINFCELYGASNQYILSFTLNLYFVVLNLHKTMISICFLLSNVTISRNAGYINETK